MESKHLILAKRVANLFAELPQVESVALSGSLSGDHIDASSDIDLYVYTRSEIPVEMRRTLVGRAGGASLANLGLNFWGPGDEWFDAATGIEVDIVYFDIQWMEDQIRRVMQHHQPSLGYSTCFAFTVRYSQVFYDPQGWFVELQKLSQEPYPEPLRQNIISHNHPVLRQIIPSYFFQLEKAVKRSDLVSVNHRLAGLLASYFDIIFAINRELHPGEKRLIEKTVANCTVLPTDFEVNMISVLGIKNDDPYLLSYITKVLDHLDQLLLQENFGALISLD